MKILVFSDSHGMTLNMETAIQTHPHIEYIIHLGDYGTDTDGLAADNFTYIFDVVQGNCDKKKLYPIEKVIQLVGKRVLLTHGHSYGVKYGLTSIIAKGLQDKLDVILFGHTHEPLIESREGLLLVNPGSISKPRSTSAPTYALLEISKSGIQAVIHKV